MFNDTIKCLKSECLSAKTPSMWLHSKEQELNSGITDTSDTHQQTHTRNIQRWDANQLLQFHLQIYKLLSMVWNSHSNASGLSCCVDWLCHRQYGEARAASIFGIVQGDEVILGEMVALYRSMMKAIMSTRWEVVGRKAARETEVTKEEGELTEEILKQWEAANIIEAEWFVLLSKYMDAQIGEKEKLKVSQLVKKFPAHYSIWRFITILDFKLSPCSVCCMFSSR